MSEKNRAQNLIDEKSEDLNLGRIIGEIIDNRWLIGAVTTLFLVIGVLYCIFATPIYSADAMVQVEQNVGNNLLNDITQILPNSQPESAPEIELLQSRMVLDKTIEDLNLQVVIKQKYFPIFGKGFSRIIKNKPGILEIPKLEFAENWDVDDSGDHSVELIVNDSKNYSIEKDGNLLITAQVGQTIEKDGITINVRKMVASAGTKFEITRQTKMKTINDILENYTVADKGKDTGVLGLTLTGENPILIKRMLDSIATNYLEQNVKRKSEEDAKSLDFLKEQLPQVRDSLNQAESKLNIYRQKKDSVDLPLEAKSVLDSIVSVDSQLNELTFKEAEISKLYTKEHPSYRALLEKRKTLENERDNLNKRVNAMPETQQEIVRLSRDVESGQQIYMQLLNKDQELSISKASTVGNVRIIDNAVTQIKPVQPKKIIILLVSLVLGIMASVGFVLVRTSLHRGIENPEQLEELGLSVYASVPLSEWQRKRDIDFNSQQKSKGKRNISSSNTLLAFGNPADLAIEAIRSLRTSLHFAMMEAKNNILMISGASPGIGKTFIGANLAAVIAQAGQKVLFIDSDMRKGYAHELMGLDGKHGLSDILSGKANVEDVIQGTGHEGLDFLARGIIPPNPSELLMNQRFEALLKWATAQYDLVIADTPPVLAVTDASIIGKLVGTALIVARFEVNTPKEIEYSVRRFEQNGIEIKGVILNAVVKKASSYYNYGYNYYGYNYEDKK